MGHISDRDHHQAALNHHLKRLFFYIPSFKIYGNLVGFYDYGPPGCAIKSNVVALWRRHFVLEENMLEVDCTSVT